MGILALPARVSSGQAGADGPERSASHRRPDPFPTRDRRTAFSSCFRADHVAASLSPLHGPKAFCTTRPERIVGPAVGSSPSSAE